MSNLLSNRTAATILTVALLAAGLTASSSPAGAQTGLTDPFFHHDRPATYEMTSGVVEVPLRDSSHLVCDLYRPAVDGAPAEGQFPGIVFNYTSYHLSRAGSSGEVERYVTRGYNAMVCNARGSGDSPGELDPFSPQEQEDNYDLIEWFGTQPWSNGNIGQMGHSYGAHSALLVAARQQPPHLKAIIPSMGIHDWYENTIYRGGIESPSIWGWEALSVALAAGGSNATGPAMVPANTFVEYRNHPLWDEYWQGRSVMASWEDLDIPVLEVGGWFDRYREGMARNYVARREVADADPEDDIERNVVMIMGPWTHAWPAGQPGDIGHGAYLAWWDHWLKEMDDAPVPRSSVYSYESTGTDTGQGWQELADWPPPQAETVRLHMTADGGLHEEPGAAGTFSYVVDPLDPGNDRSHTTAVNQGDQREEDENRVTFTTPPLAEDVVVAGPIEVTLRASFTAPDGNIAVRLMDVAPDGTSLRRSAGWLKASHREGHDHLVEVPIDEVIDLPIHVWPQHYRFEAGHQIRLSVSSGDFPEIAADAPPGIVTIQAGGDDGSYADFELIRQNLQ